MNPLVAWGNLLEHMSGACDLGNATLHHDSPCGRPMHTVLSPSQKNIFQSGHKGGIPLPVLTQRLGLHPRPSSSLWAQKSLEM